MKLLQKIFLVLFSASMLIRPAALLAQQEWYDIYAAGLEAAAASRWEECISRLNTVAGIKPQPQLGAETYALRLVDYLPYYWLGVAYFNQGDFEQAAEKFALSRRMTAVLKSPLALSLERYEALLNRFAGQKKHLTALQDSLQSRRTDPAGSLPQEATAALLRAFARRDSAAAVGVLHDLQRRFPRQQELWTRVGEWIDSLPIPAPAPSEKTPDQQPASVYFLQGINAYLAGRHSAALDAFARVAQIDPGYSRVADWISKTRLEMENLSRPSGGDALDGSGAGEGIPAGIPPVLVFGPVDSLTRADSVILRGRAGDDQGIDRIDLLINGRPWVSAGGRPQAIVPPERNAARAFDFSVTVPLNDGINRIVAIALDSDDPPHRNAYFLTVTRRPAFYRTPAFWMGGGALLLLVAAIVLANQLIRRRIAFVNKFNPYIVGAPVRSPRMFFGREALLRRILSILPNNSLMICGPRRIGKTSLLYQIKRLLEAERNADYFFAPVMIDLQGTPEALFFRTMIDDIREGCSAFGIRPPEVTAGPDYGSREFSRDLQKIMRELEGLSNRPLKLVLLIDEVDQLNSYSERVNQKLRSIFMKTFAENLTAVFSGISIRRTWQSEGSPWYNFFEVIELGSVEPSAAEELIRRPVSGIFRYDGAAVEKIIQESRLLPYRIQQICAGAVNRASGQHRRRISVEDIEAVKSNLTDSGLFT